MSDAASSRGSSAWLAHAGEVAQWAVLLLGWLWLGEQGMRLGWSTASGVSAVAVWWAARIVCRGSRWAFECAPAVMGVCGVLTACAIWVPHLLSHMGGTHMALLVVAGLWGVWTALVETRTRVSTFRVGRVAWHPLMAAAWVWMTWYTPSTQAQGPFMSTAGVSILLACCALVLYLRDRYTHQRASVCRGLRAGLQTWLAPSAMGLMMGTLWLGNAWCAGLGWSTGQMVLVHLGMMAGLPALVSLLLRLVRTWQPSADHMAVLSLGLLCLGSWMWLGNDPVHSVLAMLLPSLGWAVHCCQHRWPVLPAERMPPLAARSVALLLGPVLLLVVGVASHAQGPAALQLALAWLGGLAACQALVLCWRWPAPWAHRAAT
jgi:hypothetical protein